VQRRFGGGRAIVAPMLRAGKPGVPIELMGNPDGANAIKALGMYTMGLIRRRHLLRRQAEREQRLT
jgi:hypothetical protein